MKCCLFFLLWSFLALAATAEKQNDEILPDIEGRDCWCVLIVPKISKGGDVWEPQQEGSTLSGGQIAQLYQGFGEVEEFQKKLLEGVHQRAKSAEFAKMLESEQYGVYFLMRGGATSEEFVLSLFVASNGRMLIRRRGVGSWWLDEPTSKWLRDMMLPVKKD